MAKCFFQGVLHLVWTLSIALIYIWGAYTYTYTADVCKANLHSCVCLVCILQVDHFEAFVNQSNITDLCVIFNENI